MIGALQIHYLLLESPPPSSKPGDMPCAFIDSHIALVIRPVPIDETPIIATNQDDHEIVGHTYVLIGRTYLDFQYIGRRQYSDSAARTVQYARQYNSRGSVGTTTEFSIAFLIQTEFFKT